MKKEKEITDLDTLYEKALNGITDNKEIDEQLKSTAILSGDNGTFSTNDVLITTQELISEQTDKGLKESYVTTTFASVNLDELRKESNIQPFADRGKEDYDPTGSVKAYSRIYYDITTKDGQTHYAITKVTRGWTSYDAFISFKNTKVKISQTGATKYSGCNAGFCDDQIETKTVSGSTFSYTSPMTSWKPVVNTTYTMIGVKQTATLYDNSSSWNFTFDNILFR
ncbi:hypothetical protein H5P36_05885 [Bacillus sp. APMAM]|nr:hypothetical protein [Bacillus sp. APMAM]RTZ55977.1 hypothetical protein EKO25_09590 [Bacillus sp. SAJ1]